MTNNWRLNMIIITRSVLFIIRIDLIGRTYMCAKRLFFVHDIREWKPRSGVVSITTPRGKYNYTRVFSQPNRLRNGLPSLSAPRKAHSVPMQFIQHNTSNDVLRAAIFVHFSTCFCDFARQSTLSARFRLVDDITASCGRIQIKNFRHTLVVYAQPYQRP